MLWFTSYIWFEIPKCFGFYFLGVVFIVWQGGSVDMVDQQRSAFHSCKYLGPLHGSRGGLSVSGTAFRTVQVRGIPPQLTSDLLLNIIDRRYLCCYDFFLSEA